MSELLHDNWLALQAWWQDLPPDWQSLFRGAGVLLGALVVGRVLGGAAGRRLRAGNFDALLRAPWSSPTGARTEGRPLTPTSVAAGLVSLTVWAAAAWWLATEHNWPGFARGLELVVGRVWALAAVAAVALYLGRLLAAQLLDGLQAPPLRDKLERWLTPSGGREQRAPALVVLAGTAVYAVVALLVLLIAADLLGWTMTGNVVAVVWQRGLQLLTTGVILLIGWLAAAWVRGRPPAEGAPAGHYTALGVMGGAALLAAATLAASTAAAVALTAALLLAFVLWPAREYLPDVWAGLLLKSQKAKQVRIDGESFEVSEVGLLLAHLTRGDERLTRRNRLVLDAVLRGTPESAPSS